MSEEIKDFKQFDWDKSKDYYRGRLTKPVIPEMKSQEDLEAYMGHLFSQFKDEDADIAKFPMPSYGDTVKRELDKQYRYDLVEKAKRVDELYLKRK